MSQVDQDVERALSCERERQRDTLILIASENYASKAVMEAQGSLMTNKYAEGYPDRRYYGGCANVDTVEKLACERGTRLFGAQHANVQPHAGSQANLAAYFALVEPGDTILAMNLNHGGHLTHGAPVSFSGKLYHFVSYGVNRETESIDYEEVERLARANKPKLIVAGASSYPLIINWKRFREIADLVGARLMVDMAHTAGLVAGGVYPSPVPHAQVVTSTSHKTLRGPRGGFILCNQDLAHAIDSAVFPGTQGGPFMHIIAAKAVCFLEAMRPDFVQYQKAILANCAALAEELKAQGLRLVSGRTESHLALVDLTSAGVTGRQAERVLEEVGIVANRNSIPFDKLGPQVCSGIRLGTPAVTTRGLGVPEMRQLARMITTVLSHLEDQAVKRRVAQDVRELCLRFPVPGIEG
ncbi:MAG: serine hydroxymethyltransferase [Dehalococcoidia bacterium]|nr:serine hydroxymethyltransferase [Dehalococcoidia bacterium]